MAPLKKETEVSELCAVPRIGTMLLEEEFIVPQDLDLALEHQQYSKALVGEILVRLGAVEPSELHKVLAMQKKLAHH